jgi:hypothetical protein
MMIKVDGLLHRRDTKEVEMERIQGDEEKIKK